MSRLARSVVRIAARALPHGVRERYREEWLGDLESAAGEGLSSSSIAVGAVLFSATLNRAAPEVSGVPLTVIIRRRARWGIALLGASAVLGISFWVNGGFAGSGNVEGFAGAILTPVNLITPVLAIGLAAIGLAFLWGAAALGSALAKVSAILATMMVAILFVPVPGGIPFFVAAALGFASGICGLVAWTSASAVQAAPQTTQEAGLELSASLRKAAERRTVGAPDVLATPIPAETGRRLGAGLIAVIATISVLGAFTAVAFSSLAMLLVLTAAVVAIIVTIIVSVTRSRQRTWPDGVPSRTSTRASMTVAGFSAVLFGLVAFGAVELIVWSPQWMAPGFTIDEIYSALSADDRGNGLAMIYIWIGAWGLAAIIYLLAGLMLAGRPGHFSPGTFALVGLAVIAAMVFFHFWAGFSIGNSISDTLPPFRGGRSDLGSLFAITGQTALVVTIIGLIAPPPRPIQRLILA